MVGEEDYKLVFLIAGPNGSGKTTFAKGLIEEFHLPFLNADEIAIELSPTYVEKVRIQAGKIFLKKAKEYIANGKSFVIETTLAGRYFIRIINELKKKNYKIELIYILVENVEEAILRIEIRIKKGGYSIPQEDIIRRFTRSKTNFWNIYRRMVNSWKIFLNSKDEFLLVATGEKNKIIDETNFSIFKEGII